MPYVGGMFTVLLKRKKKEQKNKHSHKTSSTSKMFVFSRELIRGTEVSTFVLITSFIQSSDVQKYFSRCTSSLIIVCEEESANRIASDKDSAFSNTIPVKGIDLLQQNIYGRTIPQTYIFLLDENYVECLNAICKKCQIVIT
jgi:hypothetical protein